MLSARIKAIFVLLFATIVIMAVTVKKHAAGFGIYADRNPAVRPARQGMCCIYGIQRHTCRVITSNRFIFRLQPRTISPLSSKTLYKTLRGVYSDISTNQYVEDVRKIVNDYYGIYHVEYYLDHDPEYPSVGAEQ